MIRFRISRIVKIGIEYKYYFNTIRSIDMIESIFYLNFFVEWFIEKSDRYIVLGIKKI